MNDSFHYFLQLPLELRRLIWTHCLPYRIAEEDIPYFLLDGNEARQACWAERITHQNAQPPAIAFVNSESRQVALEYGRRLELEETTGLESIWVQPRRDVLHFNWTRLRYIMWGNAGDPDSPIYMFLWRAEDLGMQPSVVAEIIHPFSLKALLDGAEASDSPSLSYHSVLRNKDVDAIAWCAESGFGRFESLDITMAAVSLHIPREAALRSGLFGLLGDAPVQMVDVDDEARLREFQVLFREHALEKEPAVQTLFETFTSSRFQTAVEAWKRQAEWLILAYMWKSARGENLDLLGTNPGSAWIPHLPEQKFFWMSHYLPDEQHPWVKQARQRAPTLRPRIMVRYCTNECYIKERLPNPSRSNHALHASSCGAKAVKTAFTPQVGPSTLSKASGAAPQSAHVAEAARQLALFVDKSAECGTTILFAKHQSAVVDLYSGAQITKHAARGFLDSFAERQTSVLQICQPASAALTVGVVSAGFGDLAAAQDAIKSWSNSLCLDGATPAPAVSTDVLVSTVDKSSNATTISHGNMTARGDPRALLPRGECRTEEVYGGDSCASLAKYNPQANLCSTLQPKQHVCCTAGTMPDFRPQPQADGACNTYQIQYNDGCYDIADKHYLQQRDIEDSNKNTWGWLGCGDLQTGQLICLSKGTPPMPAPVQGATCGPQVPGTQKPTNGTALADLNTCPLNACCDVWGFCGTTVDFCTPFPADTGAPGTAKPHTNGCISNCGMDIVNNGNAPDEFKNIPYFEAFDQLRVWLRMSASELPADKYSHIHFAFATVTSSFDVGISDAEYEFDRFEKMSGFKKILSFGGWAFSTDSDTFQRFRDATKPENRNTFVDSLVSFLSNHNLDGLDFDWEYPGAPDIPDITPGSPDEGNNYLAFLELLRAKLPSGTSISIALPASYWYLKAYPVKSIAKYVDYFIYMTYDLHGQWDVGNKDAIPGCEAGNCLRSHISKTETHDAMVMLTKAGVEARQVVIGVSSYGRSFRMNDESCSGPFCTYAGDRNHSMAYPGRCTATAGYISNAELNDIIKDHGNYSIFKSYIDEDSDSNILMYGNPGAVDWAAYMDGDLKAKRIDWIKGLNFGGSTDWAIDLENYSDDEGGDDSDNPDGADDEAGEDTPTCPSDKNPGTLDGLADQGDSLEPGCVNLFAMDILYSQLVDSLSLFQTNSEGYDDKFNWYVKWTKEQIQPRLDDFMKLGDGKGLQYFDCYWAYTGRDETKDSCTGMPHIWDENMGWSIRYELVDTKGFFDALAAETGIDESWVKFGDETSDYTRALPADVRPGLGNVPCRKVYQKKLNYPQKVSDDDIQVGNPKKLIEASMGNVTALRTSILGSYLSVGLSFYDDGPNDTSATDAVIAYSMPVLQLAEAISSMKDIKDIGEKAKEQAKKDLIFKVLTIVFMVIPFVGEALGPLIGSAASVARIALLIREAGNGALTVADIIEDPSSAPFAILGLIAGAGAGAGKLSKAEALAEASKARGLLKPSDLAKFPQRFRDQDALVQKIVKGLCARK